jgi:predicted Zn-dependent protease
MSSATLRGGHVLRIQDGMRQATGITLLSLVLGGLAMAAGAGDAAMGAMALGQQAALGTLLAFTRAQESSADLAGASYLSKAGVSGRGLIEFFKKLQNQEFRLAIYATDSYNRTHPFIVRARGEPDRDLREGSGLEATDRSRARSTLSAGSREAGRLHQRQGSGAPHLSAKRYQHAPAFLPVLMPIIAWAIATARWRRPMHCWPGLRTIPSSWNSRARSCSKAAARRSAGTASHRGRQGPDQPMIQSMLGHALLSTEKTANLTEAERVLRASIGRDNEQPFAWYQLGMIYDRKGDMPVPPLATAERYSLEGNPKLALVSAERPCSAFLRARPISFAPGHCDGIAHGGRTGSQEQA